MGEVLTELLLLRCTKVNRLNGDDVDERGYYYLLWINCIPQKDEEAYERMYICSMK